jgi:protein-ribulosamine 3-kinase
MNWDLIAEQISQATGQTFWPKRIQSQGGGCINQAYRLCYETQCYFVKLNQASGLDMFEAEAEGLRELSRPRAIRVPEPICSGTSGSHSYLVLESLELSGRCDPVLLGQQLASLHLETRDRFGWYRDNTIGSTPQLNQQDTDWLRFWREQRLGYQLELAAENGIGPSTVEQGRRLMEELPRFFADYTPRASLLHGDLWSGNVGGDSKGNPVIFDPAVYFGDHETDLAMTELFGGFGERFFAAYHEIFPIDPGYTRRKTLYNLYHILNHFNLFGGGYGHQAEAMISRLLQGS